ncbi:Hypothetical protein NTJ_03317 [Nesidiocoris tenuis]|uniref:Uncharacterized protein n=1 Tax=Nesidiocoris tenuis TaxID=355587 RepID=A0ABN7AH34_9HEMI|nr:Hypothetical protein NTJ_03317 [Nesidiocoris tenuis]
MASTRRKINVAVGRTGGTGKSRRCRPRTGATRATRTGVERGQREEPTSGVQNCVALRSVEQWAEGESQSHRTTGEGRGQGAALPMPSGVACRSGGEGREEGRGESRRCCWRTRLERCVTARRLFSRLALRPPIVAPPGGYGPKSGRAAVPLGALPSGGRPR